MQILYDFDQIPQTLMLNPGTEIDYDFHIGVPMLSNVYAVAGSSSRDVNYNNLVKGTNSTGDILNNLSDLGLGSGEIFLFNQQVEIFSAGFRFRDPSFYLSFGMYQQMDGFSGYPKDFADLFFYGDDQNGDGIPEFGENYNATDVNTVFELVGVFHVGINKKVSENLTVGGRLKLLSGSIGLESGSNSGTYYLGQNLASPDPYIHNFENINVQLNTSGLLDPFDLSNDVGPPSEIVAGLFFLNGSMGVALDMGFTYKTDDDLTFTGSLLDIGMISFQHKLTNIDFEDDQIFSADYYDPGGNEIEYWQTLYISDELPMSTAENSFSYFRTPRLNASVKKTSTRRTKLKDSAFRNVYCDEDYTGDILESAYGLQVYTAFRPKTPVWALTAFYSRELSKTISLKGTYTVDRFSFYNIGVGISTHFSNFNFYVTADNLLALPNIKNSNYQSFQFGMNFIFNKRL